MEKLKLHSPDFTQENIAKLAELFPNCVTESKNEDDTVKRAIDFEQLRQELSTSIVDGPQERYQLNWPGKREAVLTANAPIAKTLRPCRDESVDFDTTQNLFIEGDNLDALKLLQETYLNKVKMIYIDPPYNTGNDFIYEDDFAEDTASYFERSNQTDDAGHRMVANPESNGRIHSDWMSMIFPRIKLARNLLREDGVLLVSIDDNEAPNLRKICDEIFGEENFVAQIVWQRSKKGDAKLIAKVHEYILCYARNKDAAIEAGIWRRKKDGAAEVLAQYAQFKAQFPGNHDQIRSAMQEWYRGLSESDPRKAHKHYNWSDDRGLYFADNFAGPDDGRTSRPRHDIFHPLTGKPCKKPSTGWRWDEAKTKWALEQNPPRIHFGPDETTIPNRKSYLEEISVEPYPSVFYRDGRSATLEVESLVGKGWFQFPKNTDVLDELIELVTGPEDIIVDFFAGSGSTGHAVWNVNKAQRTKRRFVLVQVPEPTGRDEYKTIADISKHRIRQASKAFKQAASPIDGIDQLDIGFRVLKIDSSNMKDVYYAPDAVQQGDLLAQVDNIREDRTAEDLLFQVLLDWGVDLALPITQEAIAGKKVFFVDGNALAACFETGINEEFVKALAARHPLRAVFRDSGFGSDSVKINIEQIFKLISPITEVKTL
jgi:adenine-specific DNA-methyltransferase